MAIEIPALGRPFSLGMLYDCRSETLIPGITFWKKEVLEKDVKTTLQENTSFDILASDTVSDKSSALNIKGSLKASYICGLVKGMGSANFLNDKKMSQKQGRVVLKYLRSTKFSQLSMNHLCPGNLSYHDGFDKGTATHVVTAILYGAQAFFVFDEKVHPNSNSLDIEGKLELMIAKIPQIAGNPKLNNMSKETLSQFSCRFHGDFALDRNPINYEDAVNIYKNLPKLLGPNGEKAVPVTVWLYPLNKLDSRAAQQVRDISQTLVFRAENIIQHLAEVKMECNDLMRHVATDNFPDIKAKIGQFRDYCDQFTLVFQKKLAQVLPSIRGGEVDEEALAKILAEKEESPFRASDIRDFLSKRQQEMDFANAHLEALPKFQVVPTRNKLMEVVSKHDMDYTVCLNFSSLSSPDPYLLDTHDWLHGDRLAGGEVYTKSEVCQWFEEVGMSRKARKYVKEFQSFASTNANSDRTQFVISSLPDRDILGISIFLYEEGDLVNTMFEPPSRPNTPLITKREHHAMELALRPADFGRESIESFKVEYKSIETDVWRSLNVPQNENVEVPGLQPNTVYHFRCSAVCKAGRSLESEVTGPEKTLPTSPPRTPHAISETNSLTVSWRDPSTIGTGVNITQYMVQYQERNEHTWCEKTTERKVQSCVIEGLKEKTAYSVRVRTVCGEDGESVPSEVVEYKTSEEVVTSPARRLLRESKLLRKQQPPIYGLQPECIASPYRMFTLGKENPETANKVILLLGETDSGKTALIDGLANYVLGVEFKDDFRFKLVQEPEAPSQSSLITVYQLNHERGYRIPYSLTVIDTPELDGTSGTGLDKKMKEAISTFFKDAGGTGQISAVCIVVQASLTQLSHTQKAFFHLFGDHIKENILFLINFSDGGRPAVLEAIKAADIPCSLNGSGDPDHCKVNNSALFAQNDEEDSLFNLGFWAVGEEGMRTLFRWLNTREAKSLSFSKDFPCAEEGLEVTLEALQSLIEAGLSNLDSIRNEEMLLNANRHLEDTYKDYTTKRERVTEVLMPIEHCMILCEKCENVCHYPCPCKVSEEDLSKCSSMDKQGKCLNCTGKCMWQLHFIERQAPVMVSEFVEDTDLKKKHIFEKAREEIRRLTDLICCLQEDRSTIKKHIEDNIEQYCTRLEGLHGIHLSKDSFLSPEDIMYMIHTEVQVAKPGYRERVTALQQVREVSQILCNIMTEQETSATGT